MIVQTGTAAPAAGRAARKLAAQRVAFDEDLQEQAEMLREANALRDLALEQMKLDDEVLKKYIEMI